ncbi:histidine triad nucleotide-binding protein [Myriangium duriaei CBS 260.36]|uniref:Aprataxin-like protein n=1 Tax=Myriangium duriaei CBS 260.36 TaxID=1168546 RepID=A0A9P4IW70_9PEZI|nr:histidine triad nucleotide-binding protein [Myriangium duriaei CBS 260.36]
MAAPPSRDAVTEGEIRGTALPQKAPEHQVIQTKRPNAFAELMSKKPKPTAPEPTPNTSNKPRTFFAGRDGLGAYTADPETFGPERVIAHNEKYVVIHDLYPKATIHTLVLPRDSTKSVQHPFDAFEDPVFLAETRAEVEKTIRIVASELRRRYGRFSASEKARIQAMDSDEIPDELPKGRDWSEHVKVGIHAHPSMNHLHVHVIARDMVSDCMKHRKHYQTFNTPFFVPLDAFPLAQDDARRHPGRAGYINQDLVCWKCGLSFGNKFVKLKAHLDEELDHWKTA